MSKGGFRDLAVWKKARELALKVYAHAESGPLSRDFGLREQMRRAAVSIVCNIAEGDERGTDKESVRFFYIAKGSTAELIAQLDIAEGVGYLDGATVRKLIGDADEIARMLRGLIKARSPGD